MTYTEPEIMVCTWLCEIYYCCSFTGLPGTAWVLHSYVLHTIFRALYIFRHGRPYAHPFTSDNCKGFAPSRSTYFDSDAVAFLHASKAGHGRGSPPFVLPPPSPRRNTRISAFNRSWRRRRGGDLNGLRSERAFPSPLPCIPCQVTRPSVTDEGSH